MTPQQLANKLSTDPVFVTEILLMNNPNAVADRLADVGFNRPVGHRTMLEALDVLVDEGRHTDFVHALAVPVDFTGWGPDHVAALYGVVGMDTAPAELGPRLAQHALNLVLAAQDHTEQPPAAMVDDLAALFPTATPTATSPRWMRHRVWLGVLGALTGLALIITIAVGVKQLRA